MNTNNKKKIQLVWDLSFSKPRINEEFSVKEMFITGVLLSIAYGATVYYFSYISEATKEARLFFTIVGAAFGFIYNFISEYWNMGNGTERILFIILAAFFTLSAAHLADLYGWVTLP